LARICFFLFGGNVCAGRVREREDEREMNRARRRGAGSGIAGCWCLLKNTYIENTFIRQHIYENTFYIKEKTLERLLSF